jgi:hypothetical protein
VYVVVSLRTSKTLYKLKREYIIFVKYLKFYVLTKGF